MKNKRGYIQIFILSTLAALTAQAPALEENGDRIVDGSTLSYQSGPWQTQLQNDGIQALYLFNETSGNVLDTSGVGTPLNLVIDDPSPVAEVARNGSSLEILFPTLIHSNGPATKINNACRASNEYTVEMWIENSNDGQLPPEQPMRRIVTLATEVDGSNGDRLSSSNPNFFFSLVYDDTPLFATAVRTTQSMPTGEIIRSQADLVEVRKKQHIIFTKDKMGVARLYISFFDDDGNIVDTLRREFNNIDTLTDGNLSAWNPNAVLGIGNEISYANANANNRDVGDDVTATTNEEQNPWIGKMHLLAIYCNALSPLDVLGDKAPGQPVYQTFSIDPGMSVSDEMKKAALLYKRLAGVSTSLSNPIIVQMASDIAQGNLKAAAERVTDPNNSSDFYNVTIRDFASKMSTREETVNTPLNDFISTIIGIARDDINAKNMLTGDYLYQGDTSKASVPANKVTDIMLSNSHYQGLEGGRYDLQKVLVQEPQELYDGLGNKTENKDAAGVLTSRAWMEAHATAGTNRRLVEYTFRQFLCVPLEQWADSTAPDNMVGRDINRFPAGDHSKYTTTCRSCHSVMDSLRGAFAYYDFANGFIKHSFRVSNSADLVADAESADKFMVHPDAASVALKMNHNEHEFPEGHIISDNAFKNQATNASNSAYFGWSDNLEGAGVKKFGQMVADAQAFPFCMAKRAFRSTCKRDPASIDKQLLESAAESFKQSNYSLKTLFETIAISEECLGEDL